MKKFKEMMQRNRTDVVCVELVNTKEGGNSRCSQTPLGNLPRDREFSCVKVVNNAGVELRQ